MSIGRYTAEQQYQKACEYAEWELLATLASGESDEIFERNVILKCQHGERRTLAAELILLGKLDLLHSLCASPYFTLNRSSTDTNSVVTALHAAAVTQNKLLIDKCLAALSSYSAIEDKTAYVNMAVTHVDHVSVTPFALSLIASTGDNTISEQLLAAGADPYCLTLEKTGSQHSLFYYTRFMREKFQYYCDVVKRDPAKLKDFLTQMLNYRCADGEVVTMNLMEESLLLIVDAENAELVVTEQEEQDAGIRSLMSLTKISISEHDKKVSSIREMQDLYREYCQDQITTTEVISISKLRKHFKTITVKAANEKRAYEMAFEVCENALMSVSLSAGQMPYLTSVDDGATEMLTTTIGFATRQSPYFSIAERSLDELPSYPLKARYQPEMRRTMQLYYGPMKGHTPITYAVICNKKGFIDACIKVDHVELNAPVIFGPYTGMTPLGLALLSNQYDIAHALLSYFLKSKAEQNAFFDKPQAGAMFGCSLIDLVNHYGDVACKKLLVDWRYIESIDELTKSCTASLRQYSRLMEHMNHSINEMQMLVDRGKKIKAEEECDALSFDRAYSEMSGEEKSVLEFLLAFPVPRKLPEIKMDADGPSAVFLRRVTKAIKKAKDTNSILAIHKNDVSRRYNHLIDIMNNVPNTKKPLRSFTSVIQSTKVVKPVARKPVSKSRAQASTLEYSNIADVASIGLFVVNPGVKLDEANHAVEVYNSFLDAVNRNEKQKLDDLQIDNVYSADMLNAYSRLRKHLDYMRSIVKIASLTDSATDDDIKNKITECEDATKRLRELEAIFNSHFKPLERALRPLARSREMARSYDDIYDDDYESRSVSTSSTGTSYSDSSTISANVSDASDVFMQANDSASSSPGKPASSLSYDPWGDDYIILTSDDGFAAAPKHAHKSSTRSRHKQQTARPPVLSFGEFQTMFGSASSPVAVDALMPTALFRSCSDKIKHLKKLNHAYDEYCKANAVSGLADLECAKFLSVIEGELLAVYETLLVIQRQHPRYGVFATVNVAEDLRNIMKYSYVYIFSHETDCFKKIMNITLDLTANAVMNRLNQAPISIVTREQIPRSLSILRSNRTLVEDINVLKARRNNLYGILRGITQQITKISESNDGVVKDEDSARAQLFCLAMIGQVSKEIAKQVAVLGLGKYSHRLTTHVLAHERGDNFAQEIKVDKTTPLLNHFSVVTRSAEGYQHVVYLIALMTKNDMTKLLNEILDAKSHQIEGVWVLLDNPYLIRVIHKITLRYIEVTEAQALLNLPTNLCVDQIDYLLTSLKMWAVHPVLKDTAAKHSFYIKMSESLSHLMQGRCEHAYDAAKDLFKNVVSKSRFELFAESFLKSEEEKRTLQSIQDLLGKLNQAMHVSAGPSPGRF